MGKRVRTLPNRPERAVTLQARLRVVTGIQDLVGGILSFYFLIDPTVSVRLSHLDAE